MPTAKKRINVTIDDEIQETLEWLAKKRSKSISSVSLSLIEEALELQEDLYFSDIAEKRLECQEKRISHSKAWE